MKRLLKWMQKWDDHIEDFFMESNAAVILAIVICAISFITCVLLCDIALSRL